MSNHGIKMMKQDTDLHTTDLYHCIKTSNISLAHECLKRGENVNSICSKTGNTYLHVVILEAKPMLEDKYIPFIYLLSNAGLNLDLVNQDGYTAFQLTIKRNLLQIMTSVLKCGANAKEEDETLISRHAGYFVADYMASFRKFHPGLWDAVENNNRFRVNKLVKSWCRVNISRNNISLIEYAKSGADDSIVKLLLQHEASIEFAHAAMAGDETRMKFLLCNSSVDLNIKDLSHRENFFQPLTPLGLKDVLLKHGHCRLLYLITENAGADNLTNHTDSVVCSIL